MYIGVSIDTNGSSSSSHSWITMPPDTARTPVLRTGRAERRQHVLVGRHPFQQRHQVVGHDVPPSLAAVGAVGERGLDQHRPVAAADEQPAAGRVAAPVARR